MPRVMRRTPATEKAASYSYRDLFKDAVGKIAKDTAAGFKKPVDLSDEALLEMATAGGGMLKVAGTGKLLAGILKGVDDVSRKYAAQPIPQKQLWALREALQVPQKEWGRISDIKWSRMRGREVGTQGEYSPSEDIIRLLRSGPTRGTVLHEFTHARQFNPELKQMLLNSISESVGAKSLTKFTADLRRQARVDPQTFYQAIDPMERQARAMETLAGDLPGFSEAYLQTMLSELQTAVQGLQRLQGPGTEAKLWKKMIETTKAWK